MKRIAFLIAGLFVVTSAHAQTGTKKTPTALNAEINLSYADNHVGAITPLVARQVTLDQNASIPFLLTTNIFSAYQGINLNGVSLPTPQSGTLLQGSAPATLAGRFEIDSFDASSHFSGVRANGTVSSPTTLTSTSEIVSLNAFGYNGLANVGPFAAFRCFADQTWASGSAAGTYCDIATTPDNSTMMASIVKFNNDGGVVIGSPTGGDKGPGSLNATSVFINGTAPVFSIVNSDGTLTISPTSGNVIASLNLAHANIWTGNQSFSGGSGTAIISTLSSGVNSNAYSAWQNGTYQWIFGLDADGACGPGAGTTVFFLYDQTNTTCRGWISQAGGWVIGNSTSAPAAGNLNLTGGSLLNNGTAPTGTGAYVRATSPTLITPALGTPSSAILANATGLPIATGLSGSGAGVQTALAIAANGAGGFPTYTAGSWTPAITTSATVGTPAYTFQVGSYEQIGRQVTARFSITLSGWTGSPTGNVSISGLPVSSANAANDFASCSIGFYTVTGLTAANVFVGAVINPNSSQIGLFQGSSTTSANITAAQFGTAGTVFGSCHYHT